MLNVSEFKNASDTRANIMTLLLLELYKRWDLMATNKYIQIKLVQQ